MWYGRQQRKNINYSSIERELDKALYNSVWLPTKIEKRKFKGQWREVEKLLFPGYMFVDTDHIEEVATELKHYTECIGILKIDDTYVPISKKEEEILHKLTGAGGRMDVSVGCIVDGRVKILSGPLLGMENYIVSVDKHKRMAKVEMELFCEIKTFTAALDLVNR